MKPRIVIAIAMFLTFVARPAEAQRCMGRSVVVYINGINTDLSEAELSRLRLDEALTNFLGPTCTTPPVFLAFNQTDGWVLDLAQSTRQLTTKVQDDDPDLLDHLVLYRSAIAAGYHVVVVAHSQGNLYANAAYDLLSPDFDNSPDSDFSIVSVATPDERVGSATTPYVTLFEDLISRVPGSLSKSPGPNVHAPCGDGLIGFLAQLQCHYFLPSYMQFDEPRNNILGHVVDAFPLARPTDDVYLAAQGVDLIVPTPGLLANDSFAPNYFPTVNFGSPPAPFSLLDLTDIGGGGFKFDLHLYPAFTGTFTFQYTVSTKYGTTLPATVAINVGVGSPPKAPLAGFTMSARGVSGVNGDVLNIYAPSGQPVSVTLSAPICHSSKQNDRP